MSLKPKPVRPVAESTAYVARAAFPDGYPYLAARDALGTFYDDERFADLFPNRGRPAAVPWRLALATVLPFADGLPDRQADDAVRGRIVGRREPVKGSTSPISSSIERRGG